MVYLGVDALGTKTLCVVSLLLGDLFSGVTKAAVAACFPSYGLITSQYELNEFRMECAF